MKLTENQRKRIQANHELPYKVFGFLRKRFRKWNEDDWVSLIGIPALISAAVTFIGEEEDFSRYAKFCILRRSRDRTVRYPHLVSFRSFHALVKTFDELGLLVRGKTVRLPKGVFNEVDISYSALRTATKRRKNSGISPTIGPSRGTRLVDDELGQLSHSARVVLVMRVLEDYTLPQIARRMNLSKQVVHSQYNKAVEEARCVLNSRSLLEK